MLDTLNWNICGVNTKRATLLAYCKTENYDIIALQETLVQTGKKFRVNGYNTYTTPCENTNRGLAILVKSSIPVKRIINPISCGDCVEVMAVRLTLENQTLDIYNIYRNINHGELDLSQLFAHTENTNTLITGDFNAHHEVLCSPRPPNPAGDHIYQSLTDFNGVSLLNNGQSTHIRGGRLDLSFISTILRPFSTWAIHTELTSDHFATRTKIDIQTLPPLPPPPPRWNQSLADWGTFQKELEKWARDYDPPDDIDQLEADLQDTIHAAANKAMPLKSTGNYTYKDSWYYCAEVRTLKTRLNRVRKLYRRRPNAENRELLQTVNIDVQQQLESIRNEKWMEWCSHISSHSTLSDIWKWLKIVSNKHKPKQCRHPQPLQEAERLAVHFSERTKTENLPPGTRRLQEQLNPERWRAINNACSEQDDTDQPFTLDELNSAHKKGRDTAPGADKITYTMVRMLGPAGDLALLRLINKSHTEQKRPRIWNKQDIQPVPKPRDPDSLRPIALSSCIEKTAESMALTRLKFKTGPLHPRLYAYQDGIGVTECIMDLLTFVDGRGAAVAFLDYEKAFELASPAAILFSLVGKGIKGNLLAFNKNYLLNRHARVKFQGTVSSYKNLENGTPQGGILSPFLYNILMENIATLELPPGVDLFIFADDVCVAARGRDKIRKLQRAVDIIIQKSNELGLKINSNKTKTMMIKDRIPERNISVDNQQIEWVESFVYLGIHIDSRLTFNQEIKYLRQKATARLNTMRYMTSLKGGAGLELQKTYYNACTRSQIDFAAPVLVKLTETQKESLEVIQNNAMRLMLGAPMWTRLCNLRAETNLPTLEHRINARNTCIISKAIQSDRPSHTKVKVLCEIPKHPEIHRPNTYTKQLVDCARNLKMDSVLDKLKTDTNNHPIAPPWESEIVQFSYTKLPRAKENCTANVLRAAATLAINEAESPNCTVYYTDGTVDPDSNTAGAAVYSSSYTSCWRVTDNASTMQTELAAIREALKYSISNGQGDITIHTDCKSALQALQQAKIKDNKTLIHDIKHLLRQHHNTNRQVHINWIPSHIGIPGNEKADELAKTTKYIDRVQISLQPSRQQVKKLMEPITRSSITEDVKNRAQQGSQSARWYLKATDLVPHPVVRDTPRWLAVTTHRLRLGYKANWEIIENNIRPCAHCNLNTDTPLLHYLLECTETSDLHNEIDVPGNLHSQEALDTATKLVKHIVEDLQNYTDILNTLPPPR